MKKFFLICLTVGAALNAWSQCDELFISEYVEGSRNNKALEIYNPTGSTIDLSQYIRLHIKQSITINRKAFP